MSQMKKFVQNEKQDKEMVQAVKTRELKYFGYMRHPKSHNILYIIMQKRFKEIHILRPW